MRILVVDDELVSREKMKHIMSTIGDCDMAVNGLEALKAFNEAFTGDRRYDLIMLDIFMPEMEGTEVLCRIRTMEKEKDLPEETRVKIFMVSASSEKETILACIKSGCNDYITKPFSEDIVVKKLKDNGLIEQQPQDQASTATESVREKKNPLAKIIARFNRGEIELPPMPRIQTKFYDLMKSGGGLQAIGGLLKKDPAISSKLISISNSSFYRGLSENVTLEQAISRLGLLVTKQTVDALSNRSLYLATNPRYAKVVEGLWEHALSCAHACQVIVETKGIKLSEDAFTLGLLHDIGKLMLLRVIGEMEKNEKEEKVEDIHEVFGALESHHGKTGAVLLKKWAFPPVFMQVAEFHDRMEDIQSPINELLVVHLANVVVKSMGYGSPDPDGCEPKTLDAAQKLGLTPDQIASIKEQVKQRMEELKSYLEYNP